MAVQLISAIFGIVTIPLIISKIGMADFGVFSVLLSIVVMINITVDFGINISGVKSVVDLKGSELKSYIMSVFIIRILIFIILSLFFVIYIYKTTGGYENSAIIIYAVSAIFQINYYLKSIEKMWVITLATFFNRLFSFVLILFVSNNSILNVILAYTTPYLFVSVVTFFSILYSLKEFKCKANFVTVRSVFINSYHMFIGVFGSTLYRNLTIPLLSVFLSFEIIGLYSAVEKMLKGVQGIINSGAEAIYPIICKTKSVEKYYHKILILVFIFSTFIMFTVACLIYFFRNQLSLTMNEYSFMIFLSLSGAFVVGSLCFFIGIMYFFPKGLQKEFSQITLFCGFVNVVFILFFGYVGDFDVLLMAPLITEILIAILLLMKARYRYG